MAWQNEMCRIVQFLVDDIDAATYSTSRIEETIIVSAQLTQFDISFDKTYSIDVDSASITPDPTAPTRDDAFITLVSLKAACIIVNAEAKAKAGQAVRVRDGSSEIDMGNSYKAVAERAKTLCDEYTMAKMQYNAGTSRAGHAVMTPYTVENISARWGNFA